MKRFLVAFFALLFFLQGCVFEKVSCEFFDPIPEDGEGSVEVVTELRWGYSCNEEGVVFDVYLGTSSPTNLIGTDVKTGSYEVELDYSKTYFWKVVAEYEGEMVSESPVWSFSTVENEPPVLKSATPADGASNIGLNPTLSWDAEDPEGEAIFFDLYFGDSEDLQKVLSNSTEREFHLSGLEYSKTYLWKLILRDDYGNVVEGPIWSFSTVENKPPTLILLSPPNGASGVDLETVLSWEATDAEGDPVEFDVFLESDGSVVMEITGLKDSSISVGPLEYSKTYTWKVLARDGYNSVESPEWTFTTRRNYPPSLLYLYPENNSVGLPLDITFRWKGTDPEGDDLEYDVYLGEGELELLMGGIRYESLRFVGLKYGTTYRWKVVARDGYGNETEGPVWKFKTKINLSPYLVYESPEDGATEIALDPVLVWRGGDPEGEKVVYTVLFGTGNDLEVVAEGYESNSFQLHDLGYGTVYRWRIYARDTYGNLKKGPIWSFKTVENKPPTISYLYPGNGEEDLDVDLTLRWEASDPEGEDLVCTVYLGEGKLERIYRGRSDSLEVALDYGRSYVWRVDVSDDYGNTVEGPIWTFRTREPPRWSLVYGGSESEKGLAIARGESGYTVVGYTYSSDGDIGSNWGKSDLVVLHVDENGSPVWSGVLGEKLWDAGSDILKSENGYLVVGYESPNGLRDAWVVEISKDGSPLKSRSYGGTDSDEALAVCETPTGYVVAGISRSSDGDVGENNGGTDAWIFSLDGDLNLIWSEVVGGAGTDYAEDVLCDSRGDIVVVGYRTDPSGFKNLWVFKMTSDGSLVWSRDYGGSEDDAGLGIVEAFGGYVVVGYSRSSDGDVGENRGGRDAWILSMDLDGNPRWSRTYGGSGEDVAEAVILSGDRLVVVGYTSSEDGDIDENKGEEDLWLMELDSEGNVVRSETFGGSLSDVGLDLVEHSEGGYVITGYSRSSDGDLGINHGADDIWIFRVERGR